jgi:2',3'-cyclic-nucleotide 2'-phosphodiesterase/3'-nucleotidase
MRAPTSFAPRARASAHALLLALAAALAAGPAAAQTEFRFTVLHTTDLHGALLSGDAISDRPSPRGLARISTLVQRARAEGPPVLLLDAGDALTGSPLAATWYAGERSAPEPVTAVMNRIGYDAMAVGNHEFDPAPSVREDVRRQARFPWLAANVIRESDGKLAFTPSLVKDLGGVKVGIVGLATPATPSFDTPDHTAGLRFQPMVESARLEVKRLRDEERCDVVLLLAHTGLEKGAASGTERKGDTEGENQGFRLATEVPGVDAVILGHTHESIPSARPVNVLVTQAGSHGRQLGRIDFTLERATAGERWKVRPRATLVAVADSIAEDPAIVAIAAPWQEMADRALDQTVATLPARLAAPQGRHADSPLWQLIHSAQLAATNADVSLSALPDPVVTLGPGPVTMRDLWRLYPYDNGLEVLELTGAELKTALERSAEYFQGYTFAADRPLAEPGRPGYQYDAAHGVRYTVDLTRPAGGRIVGLSRNGRPLSADERLTVAVNSYRGGGAGGYDMIARAPRVKRVEGGVREALRAHLAGGGAASGASAFAPAWRLAPAYAARGERAWIDLLVRQRAISADAVVALDPDSPVTQADLAMWLGRAYNWRARATGDFRTLPDSLRPWAQGFATKAFSDSRGLRPADPASLALAVDWGGRAALAAGGYRVEGPADIASFRRSLTAGLGLSADSTAEVGGLTRGGPGTRDTLRAAQALAVVANTRFPQLRVLETTDFHGAILPGATERRSGRPLGGSAVLAAWVERLRAENPEGTVLLDGGDCFQGTMVSNLQYGRPVVEQMNLLRYTAMAVGNHEFDWTADTLVNRVGAMSFSALAANMVEKKSGKMPSWARPDTSFIRRGVPVGVLGLAYRNTPSVTMPAYVAHLRFGDDSAAAAKRVPALRKTNTVVLGVGHIPTEADSLRRARGGDLLRLARGVKGVDAWFGGHSHNLVLDEVNGVPLLIAGALGQAVGVCDLVVDPVAGKVVEKRTRLQPTYADEVTVDPLWTAHVERWNGDIKAYSAQRLGTNARALGRDRGGESGIGNFVTDAMRAHSGVDVALQNAGGLRADLAAGPITKGDLYAVMPFDNTIVTMELTGAEVKQAIEEGLRSGRVTQQSGLKFTFDPGLPAGTRVTAIALTDGSPLEPTKTYKVAANNFMASGGDDYYTLARGRNLQDTGIVIRQAMEEYVAALEQQGKPLDVKIDGRIKREGR